jgi:type I restriction enzyme S subunit
MRMVSLRTITEKIGSGSTPRGGEDSYAGHGTPLIRSLNVYDDGFREEGLAFLTAQQANDLSSVTVESGDVLLNITGASVARCCLAPDRFLPARVNQHVCIIRPTKTVLDSHYLQHLLISGATKGRLLRIGESGGATRQAITKADLQNLEIPLPALQDQKRIAAVLDAADALRAKRRESVAQIDLLIQATFGDMFGNPVVNPKGWEECRFADVIDRLEGGKNVLPSESPSDHRILKVSAVTYGEYRPEESKWLPADFIPPDSYIVRSGDLLISRANTVDLIGATAYVWDTPARMVLPDKIWRFVWRDRAPIDSLYVFHMTRHKDFQRMIGSRASGTSGSMKNISKPKLLGLTIPLPPLPMQQEFAERVRRIRAQRAILVKQLFELDSLFSSLQTQAFNGRLSTSVLSDPLSA